MIDLWKRSPGVGLSSADERASIARYLERNPGMSFGARENERLVGILLSGHDGRRGYLYHLAIDPKYRRAGLGKALVENAIEALRNEGIEKCHLFMFKRNRLARRFWQAMGWEERKDIELRSTQL